MFVTINTANNCTEVAGRFASDLVTHLQNRVSTRVRPVLDASKPIRVKFGFTLKKMVSVDVEEQSISLKLWVNSHWVNELLTWDPKNFSNITSIQLMENDVWTPNLIPLEEMHEGMILL